jgi:hypothetical protein
MSFLSVKSCQHIILSAINWLRSFNKYLIFGYGSMQSMSLMWYQSCSMLHKGRIELAFLSCTHNSTHDSRPLLPIGTRHRLIKRANFREPWIYQRLSGAITVIKSFNEEILESNPSFVLLMRQSFVGFLKCLSATAGQGIYSLNQNSPITVILFTHKVHFSKSILIRRSIPQCSQRYCNIRVRQPLFTFL